MTMKRRNFFTTLLGLSVFSRKQKEQVPNPRPSAGILVCETKISGKDLMIAYNRHLSNL